MNANIRGIDIYYTIEGKQGAPWLTFSNSLCTDHHMWDAQVAELGKSFRIVRYDTRGHGRSPAPKGSWTMHDLAADVRGLLQSLGVDRTHFIGLSMGGMIGQTLALEYPGFLESLVLADTSNDMSPMKEVWDGRIAAASKGGMAAVEGEIIERWFTAGFFQTGKAETDRIAEMIRATSVAGFVGCCQALRGFALKDRIGAIMQVPVQIIVGDTDTRLVPASHAMKALIPRSRLAVLKDAAHISNVEQPSAFNDTLARFYASL